MLVTLALGRLSQEDQLEFGASLGCSVENKNKTKRSQSPNFLEDKLSLKTARPPS